MLMIMIDFDSTNCTNFSFQLDIFLYFSGEYIALIMSAMNTMVYLLLFQSMEQFEIST